MGWRSGAFGDVSHVADHGPSRHRANGSEWSGLKIAIIKRKRAGGWRWTRSRRRSWRRCWARCWGRARGWSRRRTRKRLRSNDDGVYHLISGTVARADSRETQSAGRAVSGERELVMLESDVRGCEGACFGRSDGLVERCARTEHLDLQLERRRTMSAENCSVEIQ